MRTNLLGWDLLRLFDVQPQGVAEESQRRLEVGDSDADMIDRRLHGWCPGCEGPRPTARLKISSTAEYGSVSRSAMRVSVRSNSPAPSTRVSTWVKNLCPRSSRRRHSARARRRVCCVPAV